MTGGVIQSALPLVIPGVPVREHRHSRVLQSRLAVPRGGIMVHYDDSSRDDWAVAWFDDPQCTNGYTWLVLDDGAVVELANPGSRTPHAVVCRTENANSRFYGVSAATNGTVIATAVQVQAIVGICEAVFWFHGWTADAVDTRIVGHDAEAIWTPRSTRDAGMSDERGRALWGRLGRKVDPTGVRRDRLRIVDVSAIRRAVARRLGGGEVGDE